MKSLPLKICLDARLTDASGGGGAKVVIGLASGLSKLTEGGEEFFFQTYSDASDWIQPYMRGPCQLLKCGPAPRPSLKQKFASFRWARSIWHTASYPLERWIVRPTVSNGSLEKAGFDLVHFTQTDAFLTSLPSIFQPHDLQHLHLPQFFNARQRTARTLRYRVFSQQAQMVVAMSKWGKEDLVTNLHLPPDKVQVIPWGPLTDAPMPALGDLENVKLKFRLPESFLFFPAQTWAHKNHLILLEALNILNQDHGFKIPLVCSGKTNEFFPIIQKRAKALGLANQVMFTGFVTELELQCFYRLARALVFPTKFEGWGLPIMEAFFAGLPVACSNVTCLPAQTENAALVFDPNDPQQMALQILHLCQNEALRRELIARGKMRAAQFSWDHTARLFRAHYRRILNRTLTEEDLSLLAAPPLV